MIYIYLVIVILIIIILFIINYYLNYNIESFRGNSVYSKKYILDNCDYNWSKMNGVPNQICNSEAWVTDPRYLCSICGYDNNNPLISVPPPANSTNPTFFGCNNGPNNDLGISWNNSTNQQLTTCDAFIGDIFTCNIMNKASTADMYLFIQSNSIPDIINSGNYSGTPVNISFAGESYYYCYYYQNVAYNTLFTINSTGFCLSYLWNRQLFILDNNGYQKYANLIKYNLNTQHLWGTTGNGYPAQGMLPWMKNWIIIDINMNNPAGSITIDFNIGHTKDVGRINNDLVAWVGVANFGEVLVNGQTFYSDINNLWGQSVQQITVPNIKNGNTLTINTSSAGFLNTSLSLTYLWHGIFYSFPSSLNGFNNVIQQLSWNNYNYTDFLTNIKYCNLPINYIEDSGPCDGCNDQNYCILEQTYYNSCVPLIPTNNLLFNTNWISENNSTAPYCTCCLDCPNGGCCTYYYACQQMSSISYTTTITDEIFPTPENNYV